MAAVRSPGSSGTQRLLLVDQGSPRQIQHYADEKLVGAVEQYYPGTRLGAVLLGSKVVLFYKPVNPVALFARRSTMVEIGRMGAKWFMLPESKGMAVRPLCPE